MPTEIDNKIVNLEFNNNEFEKKVDSTNKALDKLKDGLNFDGLKDSLDGVAVKFDGLSAVAVSALNTIVSKATNAGLELVKSLSIDQLSSGFQKYESELNAVQMMLNNLSEEEANIELIEEQLAKLQTFTDETSYSYSNMLSTIAEFNSQGIGLKDSVQMMEGFATAAAMAGVNAESANHAFTGVARAMGQGYMSAAVWNSWMKTAGFNSATIKQNFIDIAKELGKFDTFDEYGNPMLYVNKTEGYQALTAGSFATLLTKTKWLDSDILQQFALEYGSYADAVVTAETEMGGTWKEAEEAVSEMAEQAGISFSELSIKAAHAAQEAKTFTDAINSVKDAVSSRWQAIFKSLFGNFEEARVMWTNLANELYDVFTNDLWLVTDALDYWNAGGGRDMISSYNEELGETEGIMFNIIHAVSSAKEALGKGILQAIFGSDDELEYSDMLGEALLAITSRIEEITNKIQNAFYYFDEDGNKIYTTFYQSLTDIAEGVTSVIKLGMDLYKSVLQPIVKMVIKLISPLSKVLGSVSKIVTAIVRLIESTGVFDFLNKIISNITGKFSTAIDFAADKINNFTDIILFGGYTIYEIITKIISYLIDKVEKLTGKDLTIFESKLFSALKKFKKMITSFIDEVILSEDSFFQVMLRKLNDFYEKVKVKLSSVDFLVKVKKFFTFDGSSEYTIIDWVSDQITKLKNAFNDAKEFTANFFGFAKVDSIADLIENYFGTQRFRAITSTITTLGLVSLVGKLTTFLKNIHDLTNGISEVVGGFGKSVSGALKDLGTAAKTYAKYKGISKIIQSIALLLLSVAASIYLIASVDQEGFNRAVIVVGAMLVLIGVLIFVLMREAKKMAMASTSLKEDSKKLFSNLTPDLLSKLSWFMLSVSVALLAIAKVITQLGQLDPTEFGQGLFGIAVILVAFGYFINKSTTAASNAKSTDKVAKVVIKFTGLAFMLFAFVAAIKWIGNTDFMVFMGGLFGMISIFAVLGVFVLALSKIDKVDKAMKNIGSLFVLAGSIFLLMLAFRFIGNMEEEEFKRGLIGLGAIVAALVIVIVMLTVMLNQTPKVTKMTAKMAEISGLLKSVALFLLAAAAAIVLIGKLDIEEWAKGLGGIIIVFGLIIGFIAVYYLLQKKQKTSLANLVGDDKSLKDFFMSIAALILSIAISLRLIGKMEPAELATAIGGMFFILLEIVGFLWLVQKLLGTNKIDLKFAATLSAIGLIVALMLTLVIACVILGSLPTDVAVQGVIATIFLVGSIALFLFALSKIDITAKTITLMGFIIVLFGLIGVLMVIFGNLGNETIVQSVEALVAIVMALSLLMLALGIMSEKIAPIPWSGLLKALVVMVVAMAAIVGLMALIILLYDLTTGIDPKLMVDRFTALSIVMGELIILAFACAALGLVSIASVAGEVVLLAMEGLLTLLILIYHIFDAEDDPKLMADRFAAATGAMSSLIDLAKQCSEIGIFGAIRAAAGETALLGIEGLLALLIEIYKLFDDNDDPLIMKQRFEATAIMMESMCDTALVAKKLGGFLGLGSLAVKSGAASMLFVEGLIVSILDLYDKHLKDANLADISEKISDTRNMIDEFQPMAESLRGIGSSMGLIQSLLSSWKIELFFSSLETILDNVEDIAFTYLDSHDATYYDQLAIKFEGVGKVLSAICNVAVNVGSLISSGLGEIVDSLVDIVETLTGDVFKVLASGDVKSYIEEGSRVLNTILEDLGKFISIVSDDIIGSAFSGTVGVGIVERIVKCFSDMADIIKDMKNVSENMGYFNSFINDFNTIWPTIKELLNKVSVFDFPTIKSTEFKTAITNLVEAYKAIPERSVFDAIRDRLKGWIENPDANGDPIVTNVDFVMSEFGKLGDGLKKFSEKVNGISDMIKVSSAASAVKTLLETVKSVKEFKIDEAAYSLDSFKTDAEKLAMAIKSFAVITDRRTGLTKSDYDHIDDTVNAANDIVDVISKIQVKFTEFTTLLDAEWSYYQGANNEFKVTLFQQLLGDFATGISSLGTGVNNFIKNANTSMDATKDSNLMFSDFDELVNAVGDIITTIVNSGIFNEGYEIKKVATDANGDAIEAYNALSTFGGALGILGEGAKNFFNNIKETAMATTPEELEKTSTFASKLLDALSKLNVAKLLGEVRDITDSVTTTELELNRNNKQTKTVETTTQYTTDLVLVGEALGALGTALVTFHNSISGIDDLNADLDESRINKASSYLSRLMNAVLTLAKGVGYIQQGTDYGDFVMYAMPAIGNNLAGIITTFDEATKDVNAANVYTKLGLLDEVAGLFTTLAGLDLASITNAFNSFNTFVTNGLTSLLTSFQNYDDETIKNAALVVINKLISEFTPDEATYVNNAFYNAGKKAVEAVSAGLVYAEENETVNSNLSTSAKNIVQGLGDKIHDFIYGDYSPVFYNYGVYIGKQILAGFKAGLNSSTERTLLNNAAYQTGSDVIAKLKEGAGVKSPSKYAREIGQFIDIGLIDGLVSYSTKVFEAADTLGTTCIDSLADDLYAIGQALSTDDGDYEYTITPVFDMTDYERNSDRLGEFLSSKELVSKYYQNPTVQENMAEIINGNVLQNESELLQLVSSMKDEISTLGTKMENLQIVLDGNELVGGIAPRMDNELYNRTIMASRGN